MSSPLDLTNAKVSETFPRLVQIATGSFYDGLGNPITFPPGITGTGSPNIIPKFISQTGITGSSISESGDLITIDSNTQINGFLYLNSNLQTGVSGGTATIITIPKDSGKAAFFDYWISDGTNMRCGTVMSVWDSSGNTKFTDTSSGDLNGSTEALVFNVDILGNDVRLLAIPNSGVWEIKISVRVL